MTAFDYAVLAITLVSALIGWFRGVVGEVLALVAWVAAFVAANVGSPLLMPMLPMNAGPLNAALAWIGVFLTVMILFSLARMLLKSLLAAVGLGGVDRLFGAGFGILRGVMVVLVLVLLAGLTTLPTSSWWKSASLAPPLETAVIAAKPLLPAALSARIKYR